MTILPLKFADWLFGSDKKEATFKDLTDCLRNGALAGTALPLLLSFEAREQYSPWIMALFSSFVMVSIVGIFIIVLLTAIQSTVILDRTPVPVNRILRILVAPVFIFVFISACVLGIVLGARIVS